MGINHITYAIFRGTEHRHKYAFAYSTAGIWVLVLLWAVFNLGEGGSCIPIEYYKKQFSSEVTIAESKVKVGYKKPPKNFTSTQKFTTLGTCKAAKLKINLRVYDIQK